jgi:hypothetical protein
MAVLDPVMLTTKAIVLALLAACGTTTNPTEKEPPAETPVEDQHFCCANIDNKTKSGDGCVLLPEAQLVACNKILFCDGDWSLQDGKATCL